MCAVFHESLTTQLKCPIKTITLRICCRSFTNQLYERVVCLRTEVRKGPCKKTLGVISDTSDDGFLKSGTPLCLRGIWALEEPGREGQPWLLESHTSAGPLPAEHSHRTLVRHFWPTHVLPRGKHGVPLPVQTQQVGDVYSPIHVDQE